MTGDLQLADLLQGSGLKLAMAESCTGGLIAASITAVAGSSGYFCGGVVAYSNDVKQRLLKVPGGMLAMYGAVSDEVARAMAEGAREQLGADIGLAVTGIAGPGGATQDKPVGTVFIALADAGQSLAQRYQFGGDREAVRKATMKAGLEWLKQYLKSIKKA